MTFALAQSDFAAKMAVSTNTHRRWFQKYDQKGWILNGSRTILNQADQRSAHWTHEALNHQPHQSEY